MRPHRRILFLALGGDAPELQAHLQRRGWELAQATDLAVAGRLQRHQRFPVVLLIAGTALAASEAALETCIGESHGAEWVALCEPAALESPALRDLILGRFFDHELLPADGREVELMLERALRRALLRRRHEAEAKSPPGLGLDAARARAERDAIRLALARVGRNVTRAARELCVSRMTLYRLMDKHGIAPATPPIAYDGAVPPAAMPLRTAPSIVAGYGPST
jgi:hypothetical protein